MKRRISLLIALLITCLAYANSSAAYDPMSRSYNGRKGKLFYVSKLGDNSDGTSWQKAFHSIHAALYAIPDAEGGHVIIVRPDTYMEANLSPSNKGAKGSYNVIIGDVDGKFGSGGQGRVVIDGGDPENGFKSYDWWSTIRATEKGWSENHTEPTFSSIIWDRWILRNLYSTGTDAGFFWDLTNKSGEGFTVIVEDCVGIGRAFGGGLCYPIVRPEEPSIFRRCYFLALDWVGDTAALLIGGWEKQMPNVPHLILENCTLVHPDNALALSYASNNARVKAIDCRFIVLNFTQPEMGGKSTGIICTQGHGPAGRLHVDLEDSVLAGFSVFTNGKEGEATTFTTKGSVKAYVQFKQPVPEGFERLGQWPIDLYERIAIP